MRVLDLFSGIGGFSLGLERAGMETVAFCEFDKKAQLVLKKHWPDVPIYEDVRKLNGKQFEGQSIQLICGGFPCQPFSQAGKRQGDQDDRHLWPEMFRLIQEIRPRWVIGENVAGLISMGLDQVLSDLESEDYSCQAIVVPACAVNAPHRRDRVWIVGNAKRERGQGREVQAGYELQTQTGGSADSSSSTSQGRKIIPHAEGEGTWINQRRIWGLSERCCEGAQGVGQTSTNSRRKHKGCKDKPERASGDASRCGRGENTRSEGVLDYSDSTQCEGGSIPRGVHPEDSNFSGGSHNRLTSKDVAHPDSLGCQDSLERQDQVRQPYSGDKQTEGCGQDVPHSKSKRTQGGIFEQVENSESRGDGNAQPLAHSQRIRQQGQGQPIEPISPEKAGDRETAWFVDGGFSNQWSVEPDVGRVAHGIPNRVDRLKQLGNAVVPQVVEVLGEYIMQVEKGEK